MLVIDASVALPACGSPAGFEVFGDDELIAPPLLWSEVRSALHEALWRRDITKMQAERSLESLETAPIRPSNPRRLGRTAWELAGEMGWAKTYDAEYLALAQLSSCRLVTMDMRLRRGTDRLGYVVLIDEI